MGREVEHTETDWFKFPILSLHIFIFVVLLALALLTYNILKSPIIKQKGLEISSLAELKVRQISDYKNRRIQDARFYYGNQTFIRTAQKFIKVRDKKSESELNDLLKPLIENHTYKEIMLIDAVTRTKSYDISLDKPDTSLQIEPEDFKCLETDSIMFGDLTPSKNGDDINLCIYLPMILGTDSVNVKIGVVKFVLDPRYSLFGLIQNMPNSGRTGEVLLVKKEGDEIVYINELRFKKNTALKFRLPLSTRDLPAVRGILGDETVSKGIDYRGKKVLAVARLIPGTDWCLVVKFDIDEIFSDLKTLGFLIIGMLVLLLFASTFGLRLIMNRRRLIDYKLRLRDVNTIRRQNEELKVARKKAEESEQFKSAFLANMSHEIRTPMTAIIGFSDLLLGSDISKEAHDYCKIIVHQSDYLLHIINDILDISKLDSHTVILNPENISLNKFLDELNVVYLNKLQKIEKNITLRCNKPDKLGDLNISTDFIRFRQIFTNLLDNAIKFTEQGEISFGFHECENNHLKCFVSDSGIGIDPKYHSEIFEIFKQVKNTSDKIYGGTGLGLAICKGNAQLLGGDIWIESEQNKGSTFYFTLNCNLN